jgi:hypothetical protein
MSATDNSPQKGIAPLESLLSVPYRGRGFATQVVMVMFGPYASGEVTYAHTSQRKIYRSGYA